MRPRLLVIGSSHVAAIALGWQAIKSKTTGIDVDFLAAPVHLFNQFERSASGRVGLLKPAEELGLDDDDVAFLKKINGELWRDLSEYTFTVVVGHSAGTGGLLNLLSGVGVDGVRRAPPGCALLSRPGFDAFVRHIIGRNFPAEHCALLQGTQIAFCARPLRAETQSERGAKIGENAAELKGHDDGVLELIARFQQRVETTYSEAGLTFIGQPVETITAHGTTKLEYNRGSKHLKASKTNDDPAHMNAIYGEMCMRRIVGWALGSLPAAAAAAAAA